MKRLVYIRFLVLFIEGVFGVDKNEMKTVEKMEGDSVILETCVTIKQGEDELEWKFGPDGIVIAQIKADRVLLNDGALDGMFKDRLELNRQTGDLTIRNTRIRHSGLYELQIISSAGTNSSKRFTVSVKNVIPTNVSEMEGNSVTLFPDFIDIQTYDLIKWTFEADTLIAEINRVSKKSSLYDGTDGRFRDRLQLNDQTGSLTITNIRTTDAGLYKLHVINTNKDYKSRTFRVTVNTAGLSSGAIAGIIIGVVVVAAVVGVLLFWKKTSKKSQGDVSKGYSDQNNQDVSDTNKAGTQLQAAGEMEHLTNGTSNVNSTGPV